MPLAVLEEPLVPSWAEPWWDAFRLLSRGRPSGMVPGPIPLLDIEVYARLHPEVLTGIDTPGFLRIIRALDDVWLGCYAEKQKEKTNG